MQYDIPANMIAEMFRQFMRLDGYDRAQQPSAAIAGAVVLECTGSGKKPFKTLNISTPSIIAAVASGAKIIKKGSGATSSVIGSSDLMYMLGLNPNLSESHMRKLLNETGFTFINIESVIPVFNSVYSGHFFAPHILSYILAAGVTSLRGDKIVYGISAMNTEKACRAISLIAPGEDTVVYSSSENTAGYFDEIIGRGIHCVSRSCGNQIHTAHFPADVHGVSPREIPAPMQKNEAVIQVVNLLKNGDHQAYLRVVAKNAGFFLSEANIARNPKEGEQIAEDTILSGKAYQKLLEIVECSGGSPYVYGRR